MDWLEITVNTEHARLDRLCQTLEDLGVEGLVIDDADTYAEFLEENRQYWDYIDEALQDRIRNVCRVQFYLEDSEAGRREYARLAAALPEEELLTRQVRDEDWENNWKAYYRPIEVGERLLVVPAWETPENPENRTVLRLDPGLIFGTGAHATTRMCLAALEPLAAGARVLDLGCGSGILAIAALLLGASRAAGCDIDPKAPDVARENAALNGVGPERFPVWTGDVLKDRQLQQKLQGAQFDLILANIVADVILALAPAVPAYLAPDGRFVCSGIIDGRETEVMAGLERAGLEILAHRAQEGWHCFTCRKQ